MEFKQYIRKPFRVEAVEITEENVAQVAAIIGKLRTDEKTNTPFISLDRRIIPNVGRAYIGWWLTRLGDNYRCYAPKVFTEQFVESVAVVDGLIAAETEASDSDPTPPNGTLRPSVNVFESDDTRHTNNISVLEADHS